MTEPLHWESPAWMARAILLLDSFERWLHRPLLPRSGRADLDAQRLYEAPFVVVSHGTEADPLLCYGNAMALALWEMDAPTLCCTPSRLTAEPIHRDERAQLLARTTRDGFVDDYQGIRISRTGRRFRIEQAIVWNVVSREGTYQGQAATFADYRYLEAGNRA